MEKKLSLKIAAVNTEDEISPEAPFPQSFNTNLNLRC